MAVNPDILAYGQVVVEVAENIRRDMAKVEAEVDRGMARLERKEAELKITADDRAAVNKFRKAQKDIAAAEEARRKASTDGEKRSANARYANAVGRLKNIENLNVKLTNRLKTLDEDRAKLQQRLSDKRAEGERKLTKAVAAEEKRRTDAAAREAKRRERAEAVAARKAADERIREASRAAREETRIREQAQRERERADVKQARRLQKSISDAQALERRAEATRQRAIEADMARANELHAKYIKLMEKRQKLLTERTKLFTGTQERIKLDVDMRHLDEQIVAVRARLDAIDEPPVEIDFDVDERGSEALTRWAHLISDTTVRLGPFTTSIGGATRVLAIFGPIVVGVVGALGALVGAVGAAAVALGGTAIGAIGAFGAALGGVGFLIPSLLRDFKNLNTMQNAYHVQVLKTGANSDKAKKKLKEFNNALGEVTPTTRRAFLSFDKLQDRFRKLREAARPDFYNALGESIKTVDSLFDDFGKQTLESFTIVSGGWQQLMQDLRGEEARGMFNEFADLGQKALPDVGKGLANIGAALARFALAFARVLPDLAGGFADWTEGINTASKDSGHLADIVDRTIGSMKSLGHFTQSLTNFLIALFGQGIEPGVGLIDSMAGGLDDITAKIRENPDGLKRFFEESVSTTKSLYSALVPIAALFMEWATIMRPFTDAMLIALRVIGKVVTAIAGFGPTKSILQGAFALFIAGTLVGKVITVRRAFQDLYGTIKAIGKSNALLRIADALTGGGLNLRERFGKEGGGELGDLAKSRGATPANPVFVEDATGSGPGVPGAPGGKPGKTGPLGKAGKFGKFGAPLAAALSEAAAAAAAGAAIYTGFALLVNKTNIDLTKTAQRLDDLMDAPRGSARAKEVNKLTFALDQANKAGDPKRMHEIADQIRALAKGANSISAKGFRELAKEVDNAASKKSLPQLKTTLQSVNRNFTNLEHNGSASMRQIRNTVETNSRTIADRLGKNTKEGKEALSHNFQLAARAVQRSMEDGKISVSHGAREMNRYLSRETGAARSTVAHNFRVAARAIQESMDKGKTDTKKGAALITEYLTKALMAMGLNRTQAESKIRSGTVNEHSRTPGRAPTNARGGLYQIGSPGARGRDTVPMNLGGTPAVVANGEQIAVFNHHQQKAMARMVPGGLPGFFGGNWKKHSQGYDGGGIVPVPGFPGESAASSVIPMIELIAHRFGLILTDAFGQGHKSPGHTVTGTAADFSGPDRAMDAAVKFLVSRGYVVGYDGRFGSQDWPGHGPSTRTSNFHFHVELGSANGAAALDPPTLRSVQTTLAGGPGALANQALSIDRDVAQKVVNDYAASLVPTPVAGGGGGAGAFNLAQLADLWRKAGGPSNIAELMAHIAMAESTGNPNAHNASGASGLWQILGALVPGNLFDPMVNALNAVAKWRTQGLSAWDASRDAWGQYAAKGGLFSKLGSMLMGRGGTAKKPSLMVGEQPQYREHVISTNPRYKKANQARLAQAAQALGVGTAAAGASFGGGQVGPGIYSFINKNTYQSADLSAPPPKPGRVPKFRRKARGKKARKRQHRAFRAGRAWNRYIDDLHSRQSSLETEVSYREGKVEEPADLLVETGRITDPVTGEDLGPQMEVNTAEIEKYKVQVNYLLDAYNALKAVVDALYRDIPSAMVAFRSERKYRKANNVQLKEAIRRDENRIQSKKTSKDAKENARKRLKKNRHRLGVNEAVINDINDDLGTMKDDRETAGIDQRQINDDITTWKADRDTIDGRATDEKTKNDAEATSGGAGGSTAPTIQMQQLSADTERANILREFKGNVQGNAKGIAGASSGLQTNLSGGQGSSVATAGLAAIGAAVGGSSNLAATAVGGAVGRAVAAGSGSGAAVGGAFKSGVLGGFLSGSGAGGAMDQTGSSVTINNTFAAPPEDPMTWTKGVMFEAQAAI